ncbi:MAG: damage repair protein [Bacilli bacterium]
MKEKVIFAIDLKSFFAFAECVSRSLDPYKVPLAVADLSRGDSAMTLAATPYLKSLGVPSRSRVFLIPKNIKGLIFVPPRLDFYIEKSNEVIKVYEKFFSKDDIFVYSIDEVFINVTPYISLYNKTPIELANEVLKAITNDTSLVAACGIGPNIFMAKIAMDTDSKHNTNNIAQWTYKDVPTKLWPLTPLSNVWSIGVKMEKKLNNLGIYSVGDINKYDINFYIKKFGVLGKELFLHFNGQDSNTIETYKRKSKNPSTSISQILYRDYNKDDIILIIREMCHVICSRVRKQNIKTSCITFYLRYSRDLLEEFHASTSLSCPTNDEDEILKECLCIFNKYIKDLPIRKLGIRFSKLKYENYEQLNLFKNNENTVLNKVIDNINNKYGKSTVLLASSLLDYSTIKERNKKQKI